MATGTDTLPGATRQRRSHAGRLRGWCWLNRMQSETQRTLLPYQHRRIEVQRQLQHAKRPCWH